MGWAVRTPSSSSWGTQGGLSATPFTVTLPASPQDGDLIVVGCAAIGTGLFTPPSGYTEVYPAYVGTSTRLSGVTILHMAMYSHVWRTGDPVSVSFSNASAGAENTWWCVILRSTIDAGNAAVKIGNPPSSGFDNVARPYIFDTSAAVSNQWSVKPFRNDLSSDIELAQVFVRNQSGSGLTAPTNGYTYQIGQRMALRGPSINALDGANQIFHGVYIAMADDPPSATGQNTNTEVWTTATGTNDHAIASVVFTDGSADQGMNADVFDPYGIDSGIRATDADLSSTALSLAGNYGGGAFISDS